MMTSTASIAARWTGALLWASFGMVHGLEAAGISYRSMGWIQAGLTAYGLTVALRLALPRRPLRDLIMASVVLMTFPELVVAAASHRMDVSRWMIEIAMISAAVIPVLTERFRPRSSAASPGSSFSRVRRDPEIVLRPHSSNRRRRTVAWSDVPMVELRAE